MIRNNLKSRSYTTYNKMYKMLVVKEYLNTLKNENGSKLSTTEECTTKADVVIRNIILTLTNLDNICLYQYQLDMTKIALSTLIKYIYRKVWDSCQDEVLKRHGMSINREFFLVIAPRRAGKTLTLAIFTLAICVNVEKEWPRGFKIAVFATGSTSAEMFINECMIQQAQMPKLRQQFKIYARKDMITLIRISDPEDIRYIQAYCGGDVSNTDREMTSYFFPHFWGVWMTIQIKLMCVCVCIHIIFYREQTQQKGVSRSRSIQSFL